MNDLFYRAFEDRHRGPRELIKSRLDAYVSFIKPLASLYQPTTAIDLGCGRGEWLELTGELGFDTYGVDLDEGMLAACRERGLNAQQADALKTLRELPADSTALISAFHVVEHMAFGDVQVLVREALRVLKPGGLLILETPNPENLVVGSSSFYLDPSHERPIPSELLSFVVEHAGFHRNKVVRLQESPELHAGSNISLLSVLNGVSPDYGVVAQKNAGAEVLSRFNEPFHANYGVSLGALAQRYDQQAESRISRIEDLLIQAETRAETRAEQAETRAEQAETRAEQAETRAEQVARELYNVLGSRSWRITAPLRLAGGVLRRFRTVVRAGTMISGIKRRIKSLFRRIGHSVLRRPRLKKAVLLLLNRLPGVTHWLYGVVHVPNSASGSLQLSVQRPASLSPHAARIYADLKQAIEKRKN